MYARIEQFPIDKAVNTLVEEGIAPLYIKEYHARQGRRVQKVEKNMADLAGSRLFDLKDTFGLTWEVKYERLAFTTGNVYIEEQAFRASIADKYLIFAGKAYVVPESALTDEFARQTARTPGGDNQRSLGLLLPLERLEEIAEEVIML